MAISSCTRTEEHALTVTFRPITEALSSESIDLLIESALAEDVGAGDVTTQAVIPADMTCRGKIVCKQDGVIAGLEHRAARVPARRRAHPVRRQDQGWREGPGRPDRRAALRPGARHDDRGACRSQLPAAPQRHRDDDRAVREGGRRHQGEDPRHAQDDAGTARAREVRDAHGRRRQPSHGPVRRGAHQGHASRARRRDHTGAARRAQGVSRRWRSTSR